jgi:hypothetical protein
MRKIEEAGRMGQIYWKKMGEIWEVRHIHDQGLTVSQLKSLRTLDQLEELVRWDGQGQYRPLRSEGNLVAGWSYQVKSAGEFREVIEVIYPGLWGNAEAWEEGRLKYQTWEEALAQATERVRKKVMEGGDLPQRVIEENCKRRCLKSVFWAGERPVAEVTTIPMLCTGPCGMFWSRVEG